MMTMPAATLRSRSASSLPQMRPLTPPESDSDRFQDSHHHAYDRSDGPEPPLTPIKTPWSSGLLRDDMQHYPYTPESMRSDKPRAIRPLSPLPSMPWNTVDSCSSPMQSALLSCAAQLENLIQTREPTDEQMEYLVSKFEEMARFLSAPEAQSKQTDDHLFSEADGPHDATGLGIISEETTNQHSSPTFDDLALSQGYVLEVGKYIENVKMHVQDLAMRMDEVKQLNSIQLDIISDLRRELNQKSSQLRQEKDVEARDQPVTEVAPQTTGFWSAVGDALDAVGEMLYE